MKSILYRTAVLAALLAGSVSARGVELTRDALLLEQGIGFVNNTYDSEKAAERFRLVIESETASGEMKRDACLWLAHTFLFEGLEEKAKGAVREMFQKGLYNNESVIPRELAGNGKLMFIIAEEQKAQGYFSAEGGVKSTAVQENRGKKPEEKKKTRNGKAKYLLGMVFIIAYCAAIF